MESPLSIDDTARPCLHLRGNWTLTHYAMLRRQVRRPDLRPVRMDASGLTGIDTAGATLLIDLLGSAQIRELLPRAEGLSEERRALLLSVADAMQRKPEPPEDIQPWRLTDMVEATGRLTWLHLQHLLQFLSFLGMSLVTLFHVLPRPDRWRVTATVAQMHQAGFNALPIVALLNFLVGAVVAFLGATVLQQFGADIYTVDLVAYAFMRELGVLLAAILLAGRTASAFTAQIGSMKVNEELDALRVQGLDPMELLVLPRLLALVITLPLLAFVAVLSGMTGGAMVALLSLDISVTQFIGIVHDIPVQHLLLGLAKAPVFALMIALIGCLEGFKVSGSARSVGEHTTAAVVQSIFAVIVLDAVAALFYMEMGW
ncbi:MAG: MlaE family ABC transporter permease [Pseudomonadota bacterium]